jgi:acyl carrier protein
MALLQSADKVQQKIVSVLARMLAIAPESVRADVRYRDIFDSDPTALRAFLTQVEKALGVSLNDSVTDSYPTVAELAAYCAEHLSAPRGERLYVVLCQMPDGNTRERIYSAPRHELAAKKAMDDGAAAVISVEREDAEDRAPRKSSVLLKFLLPLLVGLVLGAMVVAFFGWRHGYLRF